MSQARSTGQGSPPLGEGEDAGGVQPHSEQDAEARRAAVAPTEPPPAPLHIDPPPLTGAATETDPIAVAQVREAVLSARSPHAHVMLVVYHRQGTETVRLQEGSGVVVGRDPSADLVIPERSLSRRHARFTLERSDVLVEDLGSTNGTFLAGQQIKRGVLRAGEEVMLGEITASLRVLATTETPVLNLGAIDALRGVVDGSRQDEGDGRPTGPTPLAVPPPDDAGIVMRSAVMRPIMETAMRLARSSAPVLIQGETGSGKDMLARLIHEAGPRHKKPLVCVTCSGVPAQLLESILFGHDADGAASGSLGASQVQEGVFESANGGTVLLDEVSDLPLTAQAGLLHFLETRRVARQGSSHEMEVDVRVLATTHRDLEAMCDAGTFRADLYYRLNVVPLRVPPLCERREDIGPLAMRFLQHAAGVNHRSVKSIEPDAMELLEAYPWPGNVRELRNVIERAVLITQGDVITTMDLPDPVRTGTTIRRTPRPGPDRSATEPLLPTPPPMIGLKAQMDRLEAELILDALRATNGNLAMAARRLRMPLRTLQEKMTVHGLRRADYRSGESPPSRSGSGK
ncbi:sigma 54-interacting transcriptional regulator [Chondromyces apiculatus]|nr:sigma 54-interacting transcriptional regulator [Chondromyces apiculatus]